jgi:hypothetical protein
MRVGQRQKPLERGFCGNMIPMDDISIDDIKEIGGYDDVFASRLQANGIERIHEEIIAYIRDLGEKDFERAREWQRMWLDITRLKEKINEQREVIRKCVVSYDVSHDEYDEIMTDTDAQKQQTHVMRFLEERMDEIQSRLIAGGSLDRQVRSLNEPDEMLGMRRNLYIDRKNIAEALSVVLIDDAYSKRIFRSLLNKKAEMPRIDFGSTIDQPIEIIFEESLKETMRVLSLIEQYQQRGLQSIRHLEESDRQIVYMLTALVLKKHK